VGKALLAFSPDAAAADVLTGPLRRRTAKSLASAEQIRGQLDAVKASGFAVDREESADGLACVAVPVLVRDRAIAAVSVAFPASAGNGQVLVNPLRQTATAIARTTAMLRSADLSAAG